MLSTILVTIGLLATTPVIAETRPLFPVPTIESPVVVSITEETIQEKILRVAGEYEVDGLMMLKVIECESNFVDTAHNTTDPHGGAKGIGQFLQPTFDYYSEKAGIKHPDIWNTEHQIKTMAFMWSISEENQWTCYRKLGIE